MTRTRVRSEGIGPLRVIRWRSDVTIAQVSPGSFRPSVGAVERCVARLSSAGYRRAITPALGAVEQVPFLAAGFEVREHLHLLRRSLVDLPGALPGGPRLRRGGRRAHTDVLVVDHAAFPEFWRLDPAGLRDALRATPTARLRVALDDDGRVVGYSVVGRSGTRGYLQRLAVHPVHQRGGVGEALVLDCLRWLRRRGAIDAVVNTQEENQAALRLYERLGFERQRSGLDVLVLDLEASAR